MIYGSKKMELEKIIAQLQKNQREITKLLRLLNEISNLEQNRIENLSKIKHLLSKVLTIIDNNGQLFLCDLFDDLKNWVSQYQSTIKNTEKEIKNKIGLELSKELEKNGLSLSGHLPMLRVGLFVIEIDFDRWKTKIWYGPKQENLAECILSVKEIAQQINKQKQEIGSKLNFEEFLEKLLKAYILSGGSVQGTPVSIIEVQKRLSDILKENSASQNYRIYRRADFSYDLFKLLRHKQFNLATMQVQLKVATRQFTRRRSDFLWVPNDEFGNGTTYSHLSVKGEIR